MTFKFKTTIALSCLISSTLLLSACNKDPKAPSQQEQQTQNANNAIGQLKQIPIKQFPTTADDAHDIAILDDYDRRFTEMNDSMEIELAKMKEANTLTPAFEQQRQTDNVQSALNMLNFCYLPLKTQGKWSLSRIEIPLQWRLWTPEGLCQVSEGGGPSADCTSLGLIIQKGVR